MHWLLIDLICHNRDVSPVQNAALLQFFTWSTYFIAPTILTKYLINRSVPTKNDILVPETILKKRKSQEKEREQRAADLDKKRKVGLLNSFNSIQSKREAQVMISIVLATRLRPMLS